MFFVWVCVCVLIHVEPRVHSPLSFPKPCLTWHYIHVCLSVPVSISQYDPFVYPSIHLSAGPLDGLEFAKQGSLVAQQTPGFCLFSTGIASTCHYTCCVVVIVCFNWFLGWNLGPHAWKTRTLRTELASQHNGDVLLRYGQQTEEKGKK